MPRDARQKNAGAGKQRAYGGAVTLLISAAALLALVYLLFSEGSLLLRSALGITVLLISGHMIATANGQKVSFGLYLLGSKRGINVITSLAKRHSKLWMAFADWGLAFSFGLFALFMFKDQINKKTVLLGVMTIVFVLVVVLPYLPLVLSFIRIPQITESISSSAPTQTGISPLFYALIGVSIIGGFSLMTMLLVIYGGASILYTTFLFASGFLSANPDYALLSNQVPGVAPLIPGVTIPLFAGVASLIILLAVHELSHGVLARIAKVRIRSLGVVLFGIIPLGAFVEPDETQVKKLAKMAQDRISIAGVSANMAFSLLFFFVTLALLLYVLPNISTGGVFISAVVRNSSAYNAMVPLNSTILGWNNQTIRNSFDLAKVEASYIPGTNVSLLTDKGAFTIIPSNSGTIGVVPPAQSPLEYQVAGFFYAVATLSFGLNFFVAIFNLLPLQGFDGWRVYENRIKNKKLLRAVSYLIIGSILASCLPWLWIAF